MTQVTWTQQEIQQVEQSVRSQFSLPHPVHRYPQFAAVGEHVMAEAYSLGEIVNHINTASPEGWFEVYGYPDCRRQRVTLYAQGQVPASW